jgi:hypothetical protein
MNDLVINPIPSTILSKKRHTEYQLTFLNESLTLSNEQYYGLLLSLPAFKLKNLYNYLFLRTIKINHKFPCIPTMNLNKYIQTFEELNKELSDYINAENLRAIIIMNGIQHYFIPFLS